MNEDKIIELFAKEQIYEDLSTKVDNLLKYKMNEKNFMDKFKKIYPLTYNNYTNRKVSEREEYCLSNMADWRSVQINRANSQKCTLLGNRTSVKEILDKECMIRKNMNISKKDCYDIVIMYITHNLDYLSFFYFFFEDRLYFNVFCEVFQFFKIELDLNQRKQNHKKAANIEIGDSILKETKERTDDLIDAIFRKGEENLQIEIFLERQLNKNIRHDN